MLFDFFEKYKSDKKKDQEFLKLLERKSLIQKEKEILSQEIEIQKALTKNILQSNQDQETKIRAFNKFRKYQSTKLSEVLGFADALSKIEEIISHRREDFLLRKSKRDSVAAFIFLNGNILLLKRSYLEDFHPNTWCLPGGGIDEGDTPLGATLREIGEETGLVFLNKHYYQSPTFMSSIDIGGRKVHYFYIELNPKYDYIPVLNGKEHDSYCWVSLQEALEKNLILDLGDHIRSLFGIKKINHEKLEVIKKAIREGILESSILQQIEKAYKAEYEIGAIVHWASGTHQKTEKGWKKISSESDHPDNIKQKTSQQQQENTNPFNKEEKPNQTEQLLQPSSNQEDFIQVMGGSNGAKLIKDTNGKLYVKKTLKNKAQADAEFIAGQIYEDLSSDIIILGTQKIDSNTLYSRYHEGDDWVLEDGVDSPLMNRVKMMSKYFPNSTFTLGKLKNVLDSFDDMSSKLS